MARRHYRSESPVVMLTTSVDSTTTSFPLNSLTGFPAVFPFTAEVDGDTASAEMVLVTAAIGATATVTRAFDGTAAQSHNAGATFQHVAGALDFDEANSHVNSTSSVHGVTGALVGATSTQTITNKTFTSNLHTASTGVIGVDVLASASLDTALNVRVGSTVNFSVTGAGALTTAALSAATGFIATGTITTATMTTANITTANITTADADTLKVKHNTVTPLFECLSTARPGTPVTGWRIYETDTGKTYRYDGTTWQVVAVAAELDGVGSTIPGGGFNTVSQPDLAYSICDPLTGTAGQPGQRLTINKQLLTGAPAGIYMVQAHAQMSSDSTSVVSQGRFAIACYSGTRDDDLGPPGDSFLKYVHRYAREDFVGQNVRGLGATRLYNHPGGDLHMYVFYQPYIGTASARYYYYGSYTNMVKVN